MQLRTLRYFQELAHCASLRKASERLHVAPTAISRQIEQLEHHFGALLLERGPRGIRLTAEGEFLAERIDTVLRELDEVKTLISERRNLEAGSVSVYASEGIVSGLLAPVLADFTRRYPRIRFDIAVASAQHTLDALCQGRADLGVGFYLPHRADVEILETVDLSHRVLVPSTHPLSARASVTLAELVDQPLAIPDAAFGVRQALERIAKRCGVTLKPLFTTCSLETQKALARQGAALLILPCFAMRDANGAAPADDTGLHAVPIADTELRQVSVELCVYRYRPRSIAVNKCIEMLKAAMARQRRAAADGEEG